MTKKGDFSMKTLAELIIVLMVLVVVILFGLSISGYLSPEAASVGCGLNLRVTAATLSHSTIKAGFVGTYTFIGAPVLMCNQYQKPVDINAADFKSCPGISDFCSKAKGDVLVECWKQCARIRINKLADTCWTMAGSGRLDFMDTVLYNAGKIVSSPKSIVAYATVGTIGYLIAGPIGAKVLVGGIFTLVIGHEDRAKVLRCFRFKIVNPIIGPDRQLINYADESFGHSWLYGLNTTNIIGSKLCTTSATDPVCSYGGVGVSYINDMSTGANYTIGGNTLRLPEAVDVKLEPGEALDCLSLDILTDSEKFRTCYELMAGGYLNYNITDPRNQVCYIAYYQGGSGRKFVTISCKAWNEYTGNAVYMN
jgi:hypothetical protein